jgi:TonB family protein
VIVLRGGTAAHAGTPPPSAVPGASPPTPTARGGVPAAPATPEARAHAQPTAADPARTSAEASAPSTDRTERAAAAPSADRTERTAAAPSASRADDAAVAPSAGRTERVAAALSAGRAEPAASPGQTSRAAPSAAHAGATAAHAAPTAPGPHGPPADAASRRAPPRTASLALPAAAAEACSDITCIVNGSDPCCAMYRRSAADGTPAAARTNLPDHLDRAMIAGVLAQIDTSGCGKQSPAHGDVKLSIKVSPAGAVTGVTVKSSPDPALDACVTAAVRKATFGATQYGGSFANVWRF